jgi:hypothetical protein
MYRSTNIAVLRMFKSDKRSLSALFSYYPSTTMRKFLLIVATVIFLYSPYGPSWGRFAVNMTLIVLVGSFFMKRVPKPRYYDEEEEYR